MHKSMYILGQMWSQEKAGSEKTSVGMAREKIRLLNYKNSIIYYTSTVLGVTIVTL